MPFVNFSPITPQRGLTVEFSNINIRYIYIFDNALNPRFYDRTFYQTYTLASIQATVQSSHITQISYISLHYCETLGKVHLELLM